MWFLALIIGCLIGFSFAYLIVAIMAVRSNNYGDSKGTFKDFNERPLHMIDKMDNIRKP